MTGADPKWALIAITKHGAVHAARLRDMLPGSEVFVGGKGRDHLPPELSSGATLFEGGLVDFAAKIWSRYDGHVLFVSLGAVVRVIAPLLRDKHVDPAVVVVDDQARFAISVLSGHIGGANSLARRVAEALGATPVVTTASDVNKTVPVDLLGRELGWTIEDQRNVTSVSASVVNEEPVAVVQTAGESNWWKEPLPKNLHPVSMADATDAKFRAALVITDGPVPEEVRKKAVVYRPRSLVAGMGCDIGAAPEDAERFLLETLAKHGLSVLSVRGLATLDRKRDEPAFLHLCGKYGWPLETFTKDELNTVVDLPNPSQKVFKYAGTFGVSEPASMISAGRAAGNGGLGELVVPKQKANMLTLAVSRVPFREGSGHG